MAMQIKEGTEASKKKKGSLKLSEEEENILWGIFINSNMLDSQEKHYIVSKLLRAILSSKC